jgi:hypothetical protein
MPPKKTPLYPLVRLPTVCHSLIKNVKGKFSACSARSLLDPGINGGQGYAFRYEWLLANDIEERVEKLCNVAAIANSECFDEIKSRGGWTADELTAGDHV